MEVSYLDRNLFLERKSTQFANEIKDKIIKHGYCLTNFGRLSDVQLIEISKNVGSLYNIKLPIISVKSDSSKVGITLTNSEVYPHNECAYSYNVPRYVLLYCEYSTVSDGEFYLIDSQSVLSDLGNVFFEELEKIEVQISNSRNGINVKKHLIQKYEKTEASYLSYSTIYLQNNNQNVYSYINYDYEPLSIQRLNKLLLDNKYRNYHNWRDADLLIFDNFRFLHGRNSYQNLDRHIKHIRIS